MTKEVKEAILEAFAKELEIRNQNTLAKGMIDIEALESMTDLVNALYVVEQRLNS